MAGYDKLQIKPKHHLIANELALGLSLKDICEYRDLNHATWLQITRCEPFKALVEEKRIKIEEEMLADIGDTPVMRHLKANTLRAAKRIGEEIDNEDIATGGTAGTRLKAAIANLELAGVSRKDDQGKSSNVIFIALSEEKLNALTRAPMTLGEQPINITEDSLVLSSETSQSNS